MFFRTGFEIGPSRWWPRFDANGVTFCCPGLSACACEHGFEFVRNSLAAYDRVARSNQHDDYDALANFRRLTSMVQQADAVLECRNCVLWPVSAWVKTVASQVRVIDLDAWCHQPNCRVIRRRRYANASLELQFPRARVNAWSGLTLRFAHALR